MEVHPTPAEKQFLSIAYNRFYDLFEEVMSDEFWNSPASHRLFVVSSGFAIYSELIGYEPLKAVLQHLKTQRPPGEAEIAGRLFKFIRNILAHFPLFESWNEIWISKELINWQRPGQMMDKFLQENLGRDEIKYRFWESERKLMTYISINYPREYGDNRIFLKDILSEKDGIKFSFIMMRRVLDTQIERDS